METVLITGSSNGVGKAAAKKFLSQGCYVYGIDKESATIDHVNYQHFVADVSDYWTLPDLTHIEYIVNNAGIVTPQIDAIDVNLYGYINILEKYGKDKWLKSVVNIGSTASYKGYDNIRYCASQGGRDALTKWAANNFGNDPRHVIVNSLNLDGIVPAMNGHEGTSLEPALYEKYDLDSPTKEYSVATLEFNLNPS